MAAIFGSSGIHGSHPSALHCSGQPPPKLELGMRRQRQRQKTNKQARKLQATLVRNSAQRLTDSLTGVECRATSVAKNKDRGAATGFLLAQEYWLQSHHFTISWIQYHHFQVSLSSSYFKEKPSSPILCIQFSSSNDQVAQAFFAILSSS